MAAVPEVRAADVPPVPEKLVRELIEWHSVVQNAMHDVLPLALGEQSAPLTQIETLGQRLRKLEGQSAVLRVELLKHYRAVQAAYREAADA